MKKKHLFSLIIALFIASTMIAGGDQMGRWASGQVGQWASGKVGTLENGQDGEGLALIPVVTINETLQWNPVQVIQTDSNNHFYLLSFQGSVMQDGTDKMPLYYRTQLLQPEEGNVVEDLSITSLTYQELTHEELLAIENPLLIPDAPNPVASIVYIRKQPALSISMLPFRRNPVSGNIEKILSFKIMVTLGHQSNPGNPFQHDYAEQSVLATGSWLRFATQQNGIYQITYDALSEAGIDPASIDPQTIKIYGNGGGMLPEANSASRIDDLQECAILVVGEADGHFDPGDYILFYGESQTVWKLDTVTGLFRHTTNIYSDITYYFLTFGGTQGKRISSDPGASDPASYTIDRFNDYAVLDKEDINLIKSGREWFDSEIFDVTTTRNYAFSFANIDPASPVFIKTLVAARSTTGSSSFSVKVNGESLYNISISKVSGDFLATYARQKSTESSISINGGNIEITLKYNKPGIGAIGYLNYFELNTRRELIMTGNQMGFRSAESVGDGTITEFVLTNQGTPVTIWDVTDNGNPIQIQTQSAGNLQTIKVHTDNLREFLAFDGQAYFTPDYIGSVQNQNLHGVQSADYVMVVYPSFLNQAQRLAQFHQQKNNLEVFITTPQQVYNEFSSGSQDITAIRDFMKMLYDRAAAGEEPRYLLLFGDASYDYKQRKQNNTNFVPSYESPESLDPVDSYVTDDYFVLLDDNEGQGTLGTLDLGVGRLPVMNETEAMEAIDKILHYCSESDTVKHDWRNILAFVADDGDGNLHMTQVEEMTTLIGTSHPVYNIDKIYLDAYPQVSTPGGQRSPEVNNTINKRVDKGCLIMNYTGHGGELGWSHEKVLEVADIQSWTNFNQMPVFVTATCEFSRYDDPDRVSAGEWVFLNPRGGGIALFTTTRPTFAGSNLALAKNFYNIAFDKVNGQYAKMGDLIMDAKNNTSSSPNTRKFVLLGDPALTMAYPEIQVVTKSISSDTLMALSEVTVNGEVQFDDGTPASGFDGQVYATVYDKPSKVVTLGNDGDPPVTFYVQKNQIYKGQVQVQQGQFSFSFIVPKDIAYSYGEGKISYYARNEETDAHGFDPSIVVGGFNPESITDSVGPEITLYINNFLFQSGGITNQNPRLLATIYDESGINTVGNGIGHDITATLDGDTKNAQILNDYYVADLDTYQSGMIDYPFFDIPSGRHTLTLKVWDVYNNSSEASISFVVYGTDQYILQNVINYPNPFRTQTTFVFETNQAGLEAQIELQIYSIYGQPVRTIQQTSYLTGYRNEPVTWDGTADGGWKVNSGTYIYRLRMTLPDGAQNYTTGKLVLIR
jgi:hypothetical protein